MGSSQSDKQIFSIRLVSIDHYMSPPIADMDITYSSLQGCKVKEVPVIRIYGPTPSGQKTCLHIHGALPYLYVPVSDIQLPDSFEGESYKNDLCLSLEKALKLKGSTGTKRQHVHGCSLVRGRKLYGYYSSEELFIKIYFYYPQDVSRAANLLLEGSILERSLQPYESHIPFLLQFMVDYNLYGMGHLHLQKMKFRHLRDDLSSIEAHMSGSNAAAVTAEPEADTSAGSSSRIWKASNIPEGWSWQCSSGLSTSLDAGTLLVKRQSICELEGDAAVDDILNQQLKSYVSPSQSPLDVKMVQSLIPIWQEEYERSGLHVAETLSDPGKPLPDSVLKILSNGLDYEHQFLELCGKFDDALSPIVAKDEVFLESSSVAHSELVALTSLKDDQVEDGEAATLLKWLASSQAAEDINSDGELVRETLSCPLLPCATIHRVIENTNIDYEKESQQECQDILDSIKDVIEFVGIKQRAYSDDCVESPEKKIPQVDGAGDDECSASAATSSDDELTRAQLQKPQHTVTVSRSKRKRKSSLWSPSHFSGGHGSNMDDDTGQWGSKNSLMASFLADSAPEGTSVPGQGSKALHVCSVRDLMRLKRRHRFDPSESKTNRSKFTVREEEKHICKIQHQTNLPREEEDSFHHNSSVHQYYLDTKNLNPETVSESIYQTSELSTENHMNCDQKEPNFDVVSASDSESHLEVPDPNCLSSGQGDEMLICKDLEQKDVSPLRPLQLQMFHEGDISYHDRNDVEPSALGNSEANAWIVDSVSLDNFIGKESNTYGINGSLSTHSFMEEKELTKHVNMTFHRKPHTIGCFNAASKNAILGYTSVQADDDDHAVECQSGNRCTSTRELARDVPMDVPIHYQNDGTYSYLFTPASSPPSGNSVRTWLSVETSGLKDVNTLHPGEHLPESILESPLKPGNFQVKQHDLVNTVAHLHVPDAKIIGAPPDGICPAKAGGAQGFSEDNSQLSGPSGRSKLTPLSQIGFRDPASVGSGQQLTLCSIEVQAESRGDLRPDPEFDGINIISLAIQNDSSSAVDVHLLLRDATASSVRKADCILNCETKVFAEERELLDQFVVLICSYDPDILIGWDVQGGSMGFLAERASHLGISLLNQISRTASETMVSDEDSQILDKVNENIENSESAIHDAIIKDEWGRTHASGLHVGGRIVLNLWRLIRGEIKLNMYSVEAVAEAVLHRKVPFFHRKILSKWFSSGTGRARYRCSDYLVSNTKLNLEILNQLDMVNRTSELARVFGIDFFSVMNRGSQYRVESMLMRLAHMQNYIAISPGYQQVASQPAMECLPLVMEPESGFYADPVIVLDFQSLYPSMIIAYNLCFSTCLGKVVPSMTDRLGVSTYSVDLHVLRDLNQDMLLTPNGVMYVPAKVRKGVLPRLLEEILSTRIMVKKAMKKLSSSQKILQRIFNARQLALKLIANVTYGYTAAGFSGRMPCAELADSIVQCGRRTLETAISLVNAHKKWNARVLYGDTDSMFVLVKGRTKNEAFVIGQEIASAVTAMNPYPVTLKMEKVYQPCFLLTKKRYVGHSYESPDQVEPIFDAKGIETVRRDTCGAVSKMMEKSLKIFFKDQDIFKVKCYLQRQWSRVISGRVSIQDFVFAKEVRLGTYSSRSSSLPPAAIVATKSMRSDPRSEPRYGERVPYVVVHGEPGARLVDMVVDPQDVLEFGSPYRLNGLYYINKQIIPALQRVFGLVGADLTRWFLEMPRPARDPPSKNLSGLSTHKRRIDSYYCSKHCVLCGEIVQGDDRFCAGCLSKEDASAAALIGRTSKLERDSLHLNAICWHCGGGDDSPTESHGCTIICTSLACSVYYERRKVHKELQVVSSISTEAKLYPKCMVEWF